MSTKEIEKCDGAKNNAASLCGSNVKLRRELGLFSAVNLILGVMIGSGIFVSPASALEHSGSVALCLIVWTVSGIISLLGALSFAELGTVLGKSGAEYAYFQAAFGKMHRFWGPLPSFICAWIYVIILRPAEVAIIVMTFAEYAIQPFTMDLQDDYKSVAIKLGSLSALFVMTYINITSVKLFVKVQNVFGVCKVFACLVVIGGGVYELATGNTGNLSKGFEGSATSAGGIALALYSGLWAYDGWNSVTVVTEEIINPGMVCYTAARGGHMLEVFSYVNMKRMTPAPAVAFQAILTSIFILVGNIKTLIDFASWFLWFFYGMAMVALLVLRKTHRDTPRPYRVPTPVPCFVLLVSIFLSIVPVVHDPSVKYLIAIGFMFIGVAVYTLFVYYRKTPTRLLRKFTFLTQVLFESVPPSNRED